MMPKRSQYKPRNACSEFFMRPAREKGRLQAQKAIAVNAARFRLQHVVELAPDRSAMSVDTKAIASVSMRRFNRSADPR